MERRNDGYTAIEDRYAGYTVYDRDGDKIGKVDDLFLDENDRLEYIGVKMGFLGLKSTLIPIDSVHEDQERQGLVVNQEKNVVKDAPTFDDDEEITPEFEERVRGHYGLGTREGGGGQQQRGGYGGYYGNDDDDTRRHGGTGLGDRGDDTRRRGDTDLVNDETRSGTRMDDREGGGREGGLGRDREGLGATARDDDEIRVQRSEEELRAGTREREAGRMNVRKRVRIDREQVRVPIRREEVTVDRVPVNEEATGAEIGEDEVEIPVVEEEVVVDKRPVVKEEIRLRKESVQDEEVVEEDVRKEEVYIDDQTTTRGGDRGLDRDLDDNEERRRNR
ncbi:MAG TPA: PRC and DUF2382 domain-containing protein [Rubrobacteraceae bacterium]|jgi:uncharacterized protein (TIGR02271 family)|nr:PRC and DUF2382 domain-containing protein [Rubrobacteraceae bacterium]